MHLIERELRTKSADGHSVRSTAVAPEARLDRLEFRTIRSLEELETLRPVWKSWPGTRESDLDFFCSTLRSSAHRCQPHVILRMQNGRPDAIMIGRREHRKMSFKLGYLTLWERTVEVLEFVHGALRGNASEQNCADLVQQVMQSLVEGEADLAVWDQLEVESPLHRQVLRLPRFAQRDHAHCLKHRWLMSFPNGLDAFLRSLGRSQRSKLRRKYKKILTRFPDRIQLQRYRSLTDVGNAISEMEEVARKTEKRKFGFGFSDSPRVHDQMLVAAENGWLRVYVLHLDGKPVAFWMGTLYERCLRADYVAYDPSYRELSPGIFLFLSILEDLRGEDIDYIDLGRGSTQFRKCFCDQQHVESRAHIYAPTSRGVQLNLLQTTTHHANACFVALLQQVKCLDWVKKAWRNRLLHRQSGGCSMAEVEAATSDSVPEAESLEFGE